MVLHDSFEWTNAAVGGFGLLLTVLAVRQATGAKSAAKSAREAVFRRNARDDMDRLSSLAATLLNALQSDDDGLALHTSRKFIADCAVIREHHRGRLGTDGGKLDVCRGQVAAMSQKITAGENESDLIDVAQRVLGDLCGISGALSRDIEEQP